MFEAYISSMGIRISGELESMWPSSMWNKARKIVWRKQRSTCQKSNKSDL